MGGRGDLLHHHLPRYAIGFAIPTGAPAALEPILRRDAQACSANGVELYTPCIELRSLAPYFVGGVSTILPGMYLLLNTPTAIYFLGAFLIAYALFMLMRPPLRLRRNNLPKLMTQSKDPALGLVPSFDDGQALLLACMDKGVEGIVSKLRDAPIGQAHGPNG